MDQLEMELEQAARDWINEVRWAQWAQLNLGPDLICCNDDMDWMRPSLLAPQLKSAVKRLIELSPADWEDRSMLSLLE